MKTYNEPDFIKNSDQYDAFFDRAIEEGSLEAKVQHALSQNQFSNKERDFYRKLMWCERSINLNASVNQLEKHMILRQELETETAYSNENYVIFVNNEQCQCYHS